MSPATDTVILTLTVDGRSVSARAGMTVLEACREAGIHLPTLCHDPRLEPYLALAEELEGGRRHSGPSSPWPIRAETRRTVAASGRSKKTPQPGG